MIIPIYHFGKNPFVTDIRIVIEEQRYTFIGVEGEGFRRAFTVLVDLGMTFLKIIERG